MTRPLFGSLQQQQIPRRSTFSSRLMLALTLAAMPIGANAAGAFVTDANGCQAFDASPRQGESVTWSGSCKDGKADGEGLLEWIVDGKVTSSEKGLFREGRLNGEGRIEWMVDNKVTSSEEGPFREGHLNGHGVIHYANGKRFEGMVVDGVPDVETFSMKQQQTGSHIARDAVSGIGIPPDKTYAQLSAEQQDKVKGQYEPMQPGDEPPYPKYGTHAIYEAIQRVQQHLLVDGNLDMVVQIDSEGKATSVAVEASPDPKMTQAAASILMLQQYKPALCGGTPCAMPFPFRVNFNTKH